MSENLEIKVVHFDDLDRRDLHDLLRLRAEIFVVEQDCVYNDVDGRDPDARQVLIRREGCLIGCARILADDEGLWIGRIAVAGRARGEGLGGKLLEAAMAACGPDRRLLMHAQSHLAEFYARFGFERRGEPFLEDGIPHLLMVREASGDHA